MAAAAPLRVVVADDTPDLRLLVRIALEVEGGFEIVGEAGDGAEAVRLASEHRPDAIVLDLAMPVMDGLEAAGRIAEAAPRTQIIVLSGFDAGQMARAALEAGAAAYVEKGTGLAALAQTIAAACRGTNGLHTGQPSADTREVKRGAVAGAGRGEKRRSCRGSRATPSVV